MTVDRMAVCVDVFFINSHNDLWRKKICLLSLCWTYFNIFLVMVTKPMWSVFMIFRNYVNLLKSWWNFDLPFSKQKVNTKCEYYCLFKWINWILLLFCVILTCTYWFCQKVQMKLKWVRGHADAIKRLPWYIMWLCRFITVLWRLYIQHRDLHCSISTFNTQNFVEIHWKWFTLFWMLNVASMNYE